MVVMPSENLKSDTGELKIDFNLPGLDSFAETEASVGNALANAFKECINVENENGGYKKNTEHPRNQ